MFFKAIQFVLVATVLWTQPLAHADDRPNILLIVTDNTGWGDWGTYGGGELRGAPSPRIDQLAEEGMTLLNFNTEPQCTPSRSALMTGRFAIRSGNQTVPIGTPLYGLVPWEETVAESLGRVGYVTGIFGKWHLGNSVGRYPTDQGFDEWYGIANSNDEIYWNEPELLQQPIAELASTPIRRSLAEWALEKLGMGDHSPEQNRKLLVAWLEGVQPLTDEIRLMKMRLLDEVMVLFNPDAPWS